MWVPTNMMYIFWITKLGRLVRLTIRKNTFGRSSGANFVRQDLFLTCIVLAAYRVEFFRSTLQNYIMSCPAGPYDSSVSRHIGIGIRLCAHYFYYYHYHYYIRVQRIPLLQPSRVRNKCETRVSCIPCTRLWHTSAVVIFYYSRSQSPMGRWSLQYCNIISYCFT